MSIESAYNWPEFEGLLELSKTHGFEDELSAALGTVNNVISNMEEEAREYDEQIEKLKAELFNPEELSPLVQANDADLAATPEDMREVARMAYELIRYLDGEAAEIDTEDLRFRLRRLGFWVAPVQQRGAA